MDKLFQKEQPFLSTKVAVSLLAFVWMAGLILGTVIAVSSGEYYFLLMRMAADSHVSIVGLLASACLPFLFVAFSVYIGKPKLLYIICFCKAFLFGHGAHGAVIAFGSAGWLARILLQFTDLCLVPVLCWFSIRHISGLRVSLRKDFTICAAAAFFAGGFDYCVVSPFLALLIDI